MKSISIEEFKSVLASPGADPSVDFVNVCTLVEFREKRIVGVRNVPLDEIERRAGESAGKMFHGVGAREGTVE